MPAIDWPLGPVAHRGLHDPERAIIENTPGSVAAALVHDLAVEVDLQIARGGVPVIFHDFTVDRLLEGRGAVASYSPGELARMRFRVTDDHVMTLGELLEMVGGRVPLYLELKTGWDGAPDLCRAVARMISGYSGPLAVMSFDPDAVGTMAHLGPEVPRGIVSSAFRREEWPTGFSALRRFRLRHLLTRSIATTDFVNYDVRALPALAPWVHRRFLRRPLLTWTVRTSQERRCAERWADAMVFEGFLPCKAGRPRG